MSANVGSVFFSLRAGATHLAKDIDRAMGIANKKLTAAGRVIGRGLTVALATSTAAITAATIKGINSIDQLAKESDKLGVAIDQLQLLRHAADLTGVASNQLGTGLQRMTRRVSEAAKGTGEAKDALKELRLNAQDLAKLSPDEQFLEVGKAMREVANQGDRVRLAMKLFDSEGVGLVNTLRLTEGELGKMKSELTALGVIIDREGAAKVERSKDAFTRLSQVFTGFSNSLAIELAPLLTMLGEELVRLSVNAGNFRGQIQTAVGATVAGFGMTVDLFRDVHVALLTGQRGFAAIGQFSVVAADMALKAWRTVQHGFTATVAAIRYAWAKGLSEIVDLITRAAIKVAVLQDKLPFVDIDVDRIKRELGAVQSQFDGFVSRNRGALRDALADFKSPSSSGLEDAVIESVNRVEQLGAKIGELNSRASVADRLKAKFDDYVASMDDAIQKTVQLTEVTVEGVDDAADTVEAVAKRMTKEWQSFAYNASSAIDQFVETGRFKIKDFVRDVVQDLAKIQLRNLLLGSSGTGGVLGALAGVFGIKPSVPGNALGGRVEAGQSTFVGERGIELFQPDVAGTIIPNPKTQSILNDSGRESVVVNMSFASGVSRQELAVEVQNIEERVVRGILSAKRNGGAFGETFA